MLKVMITCATLIMDVNVYSKYGGLDVNVYMYVKVECWETFKIKFKIKTCIYTHLFEGKTYMFSIKYANSSKILFSVLKNPVVNMIRFYQTKELTILSKLSLRIK